VAAAPPNNSAKPKLIRAIMTAANKAPEKPSTFTPLNALPASKMTTAETIRCTTAPTIPLKFGTNCEIRVVMTPTGAHTTGYFLNVILGLAILFSVIISFYGILAIRYRLG
jgi:hypothetical protein